MRAVSIACALILAATSGAVAQDPATVDARHYRVVLDNVRTRVFHVLVGPGETVPVHSHPDAIMVPLTGSALVNRSAPPDALFQPAQTHGGGGGGNDRATPIEFIYIELKGDPAPTTAVAAHRPGLTSTQLLDTPKAHAIRARAATGFSEPAGTTRAYDQVIVALGDAEFHLTVDGTTTSRWKRGDVAFIGRNVKYESKNVGKPADFVIVALK
jgi:beta-alanine degradation protein BauB